MVDGGPTVIVFCHKDVDEFVNLTKDRDYVLGLEKENYVEAQ